MRDLNKINSELELIYNKADFISFSDHKLIEAMISEGASKQNALKISIDKKHFNSFKNLITDGANIELLKQNSIGNKINSQIYDWILDLSKKYEQNNSNIKFLLQKKLGINKLTILSMVIEKNLLNFFLFLINKYNFGSTFLVLNQNLKYREEIIKPFLNKNLERLLNRSSLLEINKIKELIELGTDINILYVQLKTFIQNKDFSRFKFIIDNFKDKIDIEEIKNSGLDIFERTIDIWLDKFCADKNIENIKFLLKFKTDMREILYKRLTYSIRTKNFTLFKFIVDNFKDKIDVEEIKNSDWNKDDIFEKQINNWINFYFPDNFKYLSQFVSLNDQVRISIKNKDFSKFKFIMDNFKDKIDIEEIKNSDWDICERTIDIWLDKFCADKNIGNIKILLKFKTDIREILYKQLKYSIKIKNFTQFKFIMDNFKDKIDVEEFKNSDWNALEKTINIWLDRFYLLRKFDYISYLISIFDNDYMYKYIKKIFLIEKNLFKFKFFINNYLDIKVFEKTLTVKEKIKLEKWIKQINKRLEKKEKILKERTIRMTTYIDTEEQNTSMQDYPFDPH